MQTLELVFQVNLNFVIFVFLFGLNNSCKPFEGLFNITLNKVVNFGFLGLGSVQIFFLVSVGFDDWDIYISYGDCAIIVVQVVGKYGITN